MGKNNEWLKGGEAAELLFGFFFFFFRSVAMWVYVPAVVIFWLLLLPVRLIGRIAQGRRYPVLILYITVIDEWFIWLTIRGLLRPFSNPLPRPTWPVPGDTRVRTRIFIDAW